MFKFKDVSKVVIGYKYHDIRSNVRDFYPSYRSAVKPVTFEEFLKNYSAKEYYKRKTGLDSGVVEKFLSIMKLINKNYIDTLRARMNKAAKIDVASFRDPVRVVRDYHSCVKYYRSQPKK